MSSSRVLWAVSLSSVTAFVLVGLGCSGGSSPHVAADGGRDARLPGKDSGGDSAMENDAPMETKACVPPSTLGFTPVLHARPNASYCTPETFDALFAACFDQATESASACSMAQEGSALGCYTGCMTTNFTPATVAKAGAAWGGIVQRSDEPGLYFFNFGGCVAALDPSPEGQRCAKDYEGQLECQTLSCASCTVPSPPSPAQASAYNSCEMSSPCASFMTSGKTDCASNYGAGAKGPATACLNAAVTLGSSTTTAAEATAAIRLVLAAICAPGSLKGGPDGGGGG